jgi:hypothetical protein
MANFTDAISQFNPYVEQVPVELMGQVGIYKQAAYDQGVQKIQSQIDRISGLQVLHPEDKAYIQSKINGLTDRLKKFASADFSNQQLVSSVSGMTNELLKDNNIVSAVQITANLKKQQEIMDKASQEGKSSPSNEWVFNQGLSKYLETKDPQQRSYYKNFKYTPYTDIDKKWREVIKQINPNAISEDFNRLNYVNSKGEVDSNKLALAMNRIMEKGVSSQQIQNVLMSTLSAQDVEQLKIDAMYRFRGVDTPEKMKSILDTNYNSERSNIEKVIKSLIQSKSVNTNTENLNRIDNSISEYTNRLGALKLKYDNDIIDLKNNKLEEVKYNLYKDGAISQYSSAFSWEEKTTQILSNPELSANNELERLQNEKLILEETKNQNRINNFYKAENNARENKKFSLQIEESMGSPGTTAILGIKPNQIIDSKQAFENKILTNEERLNDLKLQLNKQGGNSELLIKSYLENGPSSVKSEYRNLIGNILSLQTEVDRDKYNLNKLTEEVMTKDPSVKKLIKDNEYLIKPYNAGIIVKYSNNGLQNNVKFSKNEIFSYLKKLESLQDQLKEGNIVTKKMVTGVLTDKEKILFENENKPSLNKIIKDFKTYRDNTKISQNAIDLNVSEKLSKLGGEYTPVTQEIITPKPESKNRYVGLVTNVLNTYKFDKLGISNGSVLLSTSDIEKVRNWFKTEDYSKFQFEKLTYANSDNIIVKFGNDKVIVPLTPEQSEALPGVKTVYRPLNESVKRIQIGNGNNNTSPYPDNLQMAYLKPYDIPKVTDANLYANLVSDPTNDNLNYIKLTIVKDGQKYPIEIDNPLNAEDAVNYIKSLTNNDIKQIVRTFAPSSYDKIFKK